MSRSLVVWQFTDGKAGHENQCRGLLAALKDRVAVEDYLLPTTSYLSGLASLVSGRISIAEKLPGPDLIIGAGSVTHLSMLAARRARGGRIIVLMKPTLPTRLFDLCIIPAHDRPPAKDNILVTRGALNRVRNHKVKDAGTGLILVGGPSAHVNWSSDDIIRQVRSVLKHTAGIKWTLTTSRRTPADFTDSLAELHDGQLEVIHAAETTPEWLPDRMARAACIWVSGDSVSMVYESLSSGAAVGLLSVPFRRSDDRLARGLLELQQAGLVIDFEDWRPGNELLRPSAPLDEAGRCAERIARDWFGKA